MMRSLRCGTDYVCNRCNLESYNIYTLNIGFNCSTLDRIRSMNMGTNLFWTIYRTSKESESLTKRIRPRILQNDESKNAIFSVLSHTGIGAFNCRRDSKITYQTPILEGIKIMIWLSPQNYEKEKLAEIRSLDCIIWELSFTPIKYEFYCSLKLPAYNWVSTSNQLELHIRHSQLFIRTNNI